MSYCYGQVGTCQYTRTAELSLKQFPKSLYIAPGLSLAEEVKTAPTCGGRAGSKKCSCDKSGCVKLKNA